MLKQLGAKISQQDKAQYARSPHWKEGKFHNRIPTPNQVRLKDVPGLLYQQLFKKSNLGPQQLLKVIPPYFKEKPSRPKMWAAWYGHSAIFMQMAGLNLLIDPMFGSNAAPIFPFPIRRFSKDTLSLIDHFPPLDAVLISHDHYDHLDYKSLQKLIPKTKRFFVALGVKRHLVYWGVPEEKITEFDWWDKAEIGELKITFTPSQHFAGRSFMDKDKSFWGGWAFHSAEENIWFNGDGGYGPHFKEIGHKLGPFDLAFMECGQYNDLWKDIHLFPEESVKAAFDAGVQKAMPVHWGAFTLALHPWTEPVDRFVAAAQKDQLDFLLPRLGQKIEVESNFKRAWWC